MVAEHHKAVRVGFAAIAGIMAVLPFLIKAPVDLFKFAASLF